MARLWGKRADSAQGGCAMKVCPECGAIVADEAKFCPKCGAKLPEQVEAVGETGPDADGSFDAPSPASPQPEEQQDRSDQQYPRPAYRQPESPPDFVYDPPANALAEHKKAVLSLVLGIVGMVIYWPLAYLLDFLSVPGAFVLLGSAVVGIALGVAGFILASMAEKAGNREGICTAGIVLSVLSIIINAGWFAFDAYVVFIVYSNGTPSGGFWS